MGAKPQMTAQVQSVLLLMLQDPSKPFYGLEISRKANLQRGTLYPILGRLEDAGLITGEWETIDPTAEGRRARRYYRLTDDGLRQATEIRDALIATLKPNLGWAAP
jgi:PadR family transcriptional regulator, regulatory protein PadR